MSYTIHASRAMASGFDGYMGGRPVHRSANLIDAEAADPSQFGDLDAEPEQTQDGGAEGLGSYQFLATERGQFLVSNTTTLALRRNRDSVIEVVNDTPIYDEAIDLTDTTALEGLCVFLDK